MLTSNRNHSSSNDKEEEELSVNKAGLVNYIHRLVEESVAEVPIPRPAATDDSSFKDSASDNAHPT